MIPAAGEPEPIHPGSEPLGPAGVAAAAALAAFLAHDDYPCVGAKSALARGSCVLGIFQDSSRRDAHRNAQPLVDALTWFAGNAERFDDGYATFLAVFEDAVISDDDAFECFVWQTLQALHDRDAEPWDDAVGSDPAEPDFRFSVGGHAFFVVGLHPRATRQARRFPYPTLVFNLHTQFEKLRDAQQFERVRTVIRDREERLEGEPNPLLADHGTVSEAHQYAGRAHGIGWRPPFTVRPGRCPFDMAGTRGQARGNTPAHASAQTPENTPGRTRS
ncbi:MAG: guanitoxin biosynthesis heme-dependent pre-guanitoxin N-hydroxylase GntA [Planctomycetota bacterium]